MFKYPKYGCTLLLMCVAFLVFSVPAEASFSGWHTKAPCAIVFDAGSNSVLFEKDADVLVAPSSVSKLLVLYIIFQHLKAGTVNIDDTFTVSENAVSAGSPSAFLQIGQKVKVRDLISGVAVASGNDACITIAEGMSGSQESFVEEMNRVARELNLGKSNFKNVTGWPNENTMSTRDIMLLAVKIFRDFPEYYSIFGEKVFSYNGKVQKNYNTLLNYNIGVDGMKTGHSAEEGYGMVASASREGRRIFVVVNRLSSETERVQEVKKFIAHAFTYYTVKSLFRKGDVVGSISFKDRVVQVYVKEDVAVTYHRNSTEEMRVLISHKNSIPLPIEKDQHVGNLIVKVGKYKEYAFPVYAKERAYVKCRVCHMVISLFQSLMMRVRGDHGDQN